MPPKDPANDKPSTSFIKRRGIYIPNKSEQWRSLKEKTIWDWLQLLIVPLVLASGGLLFTWQADLRQERVAKERWQQEDRLAEERRQQEVFNIYLDKIGDLLTSKGLLQAKANSEVSILAQSRTATALRQLDLQRRNGHVPNLLIPLK